ncbi:MAG: cobalamin-dependent protein [Deltaproteobacteria bacterium]|jgi:methanogenic corrinoid protein MtbC1|nr:cobalamin-dependent protein [Deltaproteobacteria bacterium]
MRNKAKDSGRPAEATLTALEDSLVKAVADLEVRSSLKLAKELRDRGVNPFEIMTACENALAQIGDRYAAGEYFIAGLIMAGEIVGRIVELLAPSFPTGPQGTQKAKVLIGTVKGDIHGLGKSIAGALLSAYGFLVKDLGVDVPTEEFLENVRVFQPDAVGLSVLLTSCFHNLKETVTVLRRERREDDRPIIFISGGQITAEHIETFGADHYVDTAFDAVRLCERLIRPAPKPKGRAAG